MMKKYLIMIVFIMISILITSCKEESSIISPVSDNVNLNGKLAKNIHSSEPFLVTKKDGGVGRLAFRNQNGSVSIMLRFQEESVENDLWVTITMEDSSLTGGINLEFGPHGNTFLKPARLDITMDGISASLLKGVNSVWYMDEDGNLLEKMVYKKLIVQSAKGAVKLIQAEIPHFSRYGFIRKSNDRNNQQ